jgi:hypothetical protein
MSNTQTYVQLGFVKRAMEDGHSQAEAIQLLKMAENYDSEGASDVETMAPLLAAQAAARKADADLFSNQPVMSDLDGGGAGNFQEEPTLAERLFGGGKHDARLKALISNRGGGANTGAINLLGEDSEYDPETAEELQKVLADADAAQKFQDSPAVKWHHDKVQNDADEARFGSPFAPGPRGLPKDRAAMLGALLGTGAGGVGGYLSGGKDKKKSRRNALLGALLGGGAGGGAGYLSGHKAYG